MTQPHQHLKLPEIDYDRQLDVEITYLRQVNWPLLRTGFPFIHQLYLANPGNHHCRVTITLEVRRGDWLLTAPQQISLLIPPNESVTQENLQMEWKFDLSFGFRSEDNGLLNLTFQLSSDFSQRPILRQEVCLRTEVLSGRDWYSGVVLDRSGRPKFRNSLPYYRFKCSLLNKEDKTPAEVDLHLPKEKVESVLQSSAALVIPDQPRIEEIVKNTFQNIRRSTTDTALNPISLLKTSDGRTSLMEAFYATLVHDYKYFYTVEGLGFNKWTQRIRLAEEIFAGGASEVTCIDLAFAYCALCERAGLDPLLVIVANDDGTLHAMPGCWRQPLPARRNQVLSLDLLRKQATSLDPEICLIDISAVTSRRSFSEAWEKANSLLNRTGFGFALDIKTKRTEPLPWHANPLLYASGFGAKYLEQLKEKVVRNLAPDQGLATEALNPESIYVALKYKPLDDVSPANGDLLKYLDTRLNAGAKRLAILGNAGTGKSYVLARFLLGKAREYDKAPDKAPIPILFPLNRFSTRSRLGALEQLREHLQSFGHPVISNDEFRTRISAGKFIFLLDALDELPMTPRARVEDYVQHLNPLLEEPGAVVVLTARSGLFAAQAVQVLDEFEIVEPLKWDEESWHEFLSQCATRQIISQAEHKQFLSVTSKPESHLKDLIVKPLFARMLIETRELVFSKTVVNDVDLLQLYIDSFLKRKVMENDFLDKAEKIQCMQRTAFYMEQNHKRILELTEISDFLNKKYPAVASPQDWERYLMAIKVYGFLDNNLTNEFYFSHDVFREFFLATKFLADLFERDQLIQSRRWADFGRAKISLVVAKFMAQLLELGNDSSPEEEINAWTRRTQKDRKRPGLWFGGRPEMVMRNLVLIRAIMSPDCTGLQLSQIDFSNLDLASTNFRGSKLNNSLFIGSNLQNCSFADTDLTLAQFSYSLLDGADFHNANLAGANFTGARWPDESDIFAGAINLDQAITPGRPRR